MSAGQVELSEPVAKMPTQLDSLTGLRWVAAFMVFLSHVLLLPTVLPLGKVSETISTWAGLGGYVGVSVFFVLSGFVLTWSARVSDTTPKFWRRRFFKVYPNHFVGFLLAAAFMIVLGEQFGFPSVADQAPGLVPQLLLVHAWIPDLNLAFSWNLVSWSLSVEAVFYLCFPLLLAAVSRINLDRLWYWVGAMVLVLFCIPQVARLLPAGEIAYEGLGSWEYWFIYVLPISRMAEFVLGIMLARIVLNRRWINVPLWLAGIIFVAGYAVAMNVPKNYALVATMIIPIVLLIPAAATSDIRARRSLIGRPFMVWLGNISYAFYLLHFFAIATVGYLVGETFQATNYLTSIAFIGGVLAVATVASWLLYKFVERPMQIKFSTSRADRRKSNSESSKVVDRELS